MKQLEKLASLPGHDVPFLVVAGRAVTAQQALDMWNKGGTGRSEVEKAMNIRGIDDPPNEDVRKMALAYYADKAAQFPRTRITIPIWGQPTSMTYADIVDHLNKRDKIAMAICEVYKLRLAEMGRIATT